MHTAFHVYLAEAGIATIPTIVNIEGNRALIGKYQLSKEIPNVFVRKTSYQDGKNLNLELVRNGLAKVVLYQKRAKLIYQDELLAAEKEAKEKRLGVWSQ